MGVYLCLNVKSHEFTPNDEDIKNVNIYLDDTGSGGLLKIKGIWDQRDEKWEINRMIVFLGESKHKIKKKAEQAACKISIDKLN